MCWYTDPNFKNLERIPPALPSVGYKVELDDGTIRFKKDKDA
jgi:hypothetical protein